MNPGERLKNELRIAGLTQAAFAKQCDLSVNYINQLVRGRRPVNPSIAALVHSLNGARIEYLLGNDDFRTDDDIARSALIKSPIYADLVELRSLSRRLVALLTEMEGWL